MRLSVIIVNYNVKLFLEQCLYSVFRAMKGIEGEVFVVDNASVDGSVEMLREKFHSVRLIANEKNVGFSRANNQALALASGEYILILNPDTLVEEDTFDTVIEFMDEHPEAGGVGVRMIDGRGRFLPESKRGLPTPAVAFYKMFGLSALFPRSRTFGRYHLGYLDEDRVHAIDVLSGAFMFLRKKALNEAGYFDPDFFMYGEDIDLSYRLTQAGYKNYYDPHARIIHYKGESTKKGTLNYVRVFYKAMLIFARKHFSSGRIRAYSYLIRTAVYFRAFLTVAERSLRKVALPAADIGLMLAGLFFLMELYGNYMDIDYPFSLVAPAFGAFVGIWCFSALVAGAYDPPYRSGKAGKGWLIGTLIILAGYSLLPEEFRFSRALVLLGSVWAAIVFVFTRGVRAVFRNKDGIGGDMAGRGKVLGIVGSKTEIQRIEELLQKSLVPLRSIKRVEVRKDEDTGEVKGMDRLPEFVKVNGVHELIFSGADVPTQRMINEMAALAGEGVEFKVAPPESLTVLGNTPLDAMGEELYMHAVNVISKPENKRNKRFLDVAIGLLLLILSPVLVFLVRNKAGLFRNIFRVLAGWNTWVGFAPKEEKGDDTSRSLPSLRQGILSPLIEIRAENKPPSMVDTINIVYAKDYSLFTDLRLIFKGMYRLGDPPLASLKTDDQKRVL